MFKDYRKLFEDLGKSQDKLWKDAMASFPGTLLAPGVEKWQQETLDSVSTLLEHAITHSMDLQREWLNQWADRAGGQKLKPKTFAELNAEARQSTERWLETQNRLWDQWLKLLGGADQRGGLPDFAGWEKIFEESMQNQMELLNEWSGMTKFKKLSGKDFSRLSDEIAKAMDKSITTQQKLWNHWFEQLEDAARPAAETPQSAVDTKPDAPAASAKPPAKSGGAIDDLKQVNGIGPGLEKKLKASGIHTLKELAGLDDHDIERLENDIIRFPGRIKRDKWVEQAKDLLS
jgi:predicted flap endonuclease-1-like 5' DNA nuclease